MSILVNRRGPILLHDDARPYIARLTLQKFTYLGYETLPNLYTLQRFHLLIILFFKKLSTILNDKTFRFKKDVESNFKDFVASQSITIYQQGINNLIDR